MKCLCVHQNSYERIIGMKIYAEIATESESELASIALNIEALVTSRLSKQNKKIFKMHIYEFMVSNI